VISSYKLYNGLYVHYRQYLGNANWGRDSEANLSTAARAIRGHKLCDYMWAAVDSITCMKQFGWL